MSDAELLDKALGALADIAMSDDMTFSMMKRKAKRVYDEIQDLLKQRGEKPTL